MIGPDPIVIEKKTCEKYETIIKIENITHTHGNLKMEFTMGIIRKKEVKQYVLFVYPTILMDDVDVYQVYHY